MTDEIKYELWLKNKEGFLHSKILLDNISEIEVWRRSTEKKWFENVIHVNMEDST